jgi:predicted DNA-binding transcriptional regulator AlpA
MSNEIQLVQDTTQFRHLITQDVKGIIKEALKNLTPKEPDSLISRKEASEYFGVDLSTIHNWSKSGKLKPFGIGSRVYFKMSDIEKSLIAIH